MALREPVGRLIEEPVFNGYWLWFLYYTPLGIVLRYLFFRTIIFSAIYGVLNRRAASRRKIYRFVETYGIDRSEFERSIDEFSSFEEFFVRRLKANARKIDRSPTRLISPADARMIKYDIRGGCIFPVKGRRFSLSALLERSYLARSYEDGIVLVFRLAPFDYHRFCYIDDATVGDVWAIGHCYEGVHPYALWALAKSFTVNVRECCILHTSNFGEVVHVDVGALGVGAITQLDCNGSRVSRGSEKGFFSMGGSTIVQVFKRGEIELDTDIALNSANGTETLVRYGEGIGTKSLAS